MIIQQYYYNITLETSKWIEALLLGSTILSWSWSLSEWIQQRGVVLLQSAPILGVPGVAALYPRLVCPEPPHDGVQPLLPPLRLLSLLQGRVHSSSDTTVYVELAPFPDGAKPPCCSMRVAVAA